MLIILSRNFRQSSEKWWLELQVARWWEAWWFRAVVPNLNMPQNELQRLQNTHVWARTAEFLNPLVWDGAWEYPFLARSWRCWWGCSRDHTLRTARCRDCLLQVRSFNRLHQELVRHSESQTHPDYKSSICIVTSSPGDFWAYDKIDKYWAERRGLWTSVTGSVRGWQRVSN